MLVSLYMHVFNKSDFLDILLSIFYVQAIDKLPLIPSVLEFVGILFSSVSFVIYVGSSGSQENKIFNIYNSSSPIFLLFFFVISASEMRVS